MSTKLSFETLEKRENPAIGSQPIAFVPTDPFGPNGDIYITDDHTLDYTGQYWEFHKGNEIIYVDPINNFWW